METFVEGRMLDDHFTVYCKLSNGGKALVRASQICIGSENDLRLRVSGTTGSLVWCQENPNQLIHAPLDGPPCLLTRASAGLCESAQRASRLPAGHPEGFIEAFANVYLGIAADIRARLQGVAADPLAADYPRVEDGARGVHFIEKVLESSLSTQKWTLLGDALSA